MLLDDIAARLVSRGVGTLNVNIFESTKSHTPQGDGPFLTLIETGGSGPTRVQNQDAAATKRPTVQVMVRAETWEAARAMAAAAYDALDGVYNVTLGGAFYVSITARQEPTDIGLEKGTARAMVAFNIDAEFYA